MEAAVSVGTFVTIWPENVGGFLKLAVQDAKPLPERVASRRIPVIASDFKLHQTVSVEHFPLFCPLLHFPRVPDDTRKTTETNNTHDTRRRVAERASVSQSATTGSTKTLKADPRGSGRMMTRCATARTKENKHNTEKSRAKPHLAGVIAVRTTE